MKLEFRVPVECGLAKVQVFDHEVDRYGKDVQKAMVWNVSVNMEELRLKASQTPISWVFHKVFKNAFIISCILK